MYNTTWDSVSGSLVVDYQLKPFIPSIVTIINLFFPILGVAARLILWEPGTNWFVGTGGGIQTVLENLIISSVT